MEAKLNISDYVIAVLLVVTISISIKLYKRINKINGFSNNINLFLKKLGYYSGQLSSNINFLNKHSLNVPELLSLKSDFDVLLNHGDKLASRLDKLIEDAICIEEKLKESILRQKHIYPSSENLSREVPERYKTNVSLLSALRGVK